MRVPIKISNKTRFEDELGLLITSNGIKYKSGSKSLLSSDESSVYIADEFVSNLTKEQYQNLQTIIEKFR